MPMRVVLIGLTVGFFFFSNWCCAQGREEELPPEIVKELERLNIKSVSEITPELMADDYAETLGFKKSSRIYKLLLARLSDRDPNYTVDYLAFYQKPVVKRISGDDGVKIESTRLGGMSDEEIAMMQSELMAQVPPLVPDEIELTAEEKAAIRKEVRQTLTPRRMNVCRKSGTKRTAYNDPGANKSLRDLAGLDLLILNSNAASQSDFIATTFSEMFGMKTTVCHYSSDRPELTSLRISSSELTCLPIRFRATDQALYVHMGADALKNYDQNVTGIGDLHPVVQERIREFLR